MMIRLICNISVLMLLAVSAKAQIITTVAGTGTAGYTGNGGDASLAQLNYPWDVEVDAQGNIYVSETGNAVVRRIDANTGEISNFLGSGTQGQGTAGEKGPDFDLTSPGYIEIYNGFLYLADYGLDMIVKMSLSDSIVYVVAGTGTNGFSADGTSATAANLNLPTGIVHGTDGTFYFGEAGNNIIRKINASGNLETIGGVAGSSTSLDGPVGTATINQPYGIVIDINNNIVFCDVTVSKIRKIDQTAGVITTIAGSILGYFGDGLTALSAQFNVPHDLEISPDGDLYISDTENNRIRKIDAATQIVTTVVGLGNTTGYSGDGGDPALAEIDGTLGLTFGNQGQLYFGELDNNVLRKVENCINPDMPTVTSVSGETTINCGDSIKLAVAGDLNSALEWHWYAGGCDGDVAGQGQAISVLLDQSTTFYVRGEGGCIVADQCASILISVNPCDSTIVTSEVITAFTPNNDNVNDFLFIESVLDNPFNTVTVYNRWGNVIREFVNYNNEDVVWDGTDELDVSVGGGTYFYIFESDNIQLSSWVSVIK